MRLPFMQLESDLVAHGASTVARLAGCSVPQALGHIALLRAWAVSRATDEAPPDGMVLGDAAPRLIEAAAGWEGEKGALLQALVDAGQVERLPDGLRVLHLNPYVTAWERRNRRHVWDAEYPEAFDPGPPLVRLLTPKERAQRAAEAAANEPARRAAEAERRERIRGKPHVYFIQQGDSGAIKIGCSKNPTQRLAGLQTGHSEALRLLTCAVGSQAQERALHDRFAHLRVSGEWFRPAEELLAYIRLVNDRRAL